MTLLTGAKVTRLLINQSGREVTVVEVEHNGQAQQATADIVVVSCGAINSAALLLRSANDQHPNRLANRSDQVGQNSMKHQNGAIVGITRQPNSTVFQKTLGSNNFYWGEPGFDYPIGHVQLLSKVNKEMIILASQIRPPYCFIGG